MNAGLLVFVTEILKASTLSGNVPWETGLNIQIVLRGVKLHPRKKVGLRKNVKIVEKIRF